jgi:hypothetical protein
MDNLEKMATLGTQDKRRRQTKQKTQHRKLNGKGLPFVRTCVHPQCLVQSDLRYVHDQACLSHIFSFLDSATSFL